MGLGKGKGEYGVEIKRYHRCPFWTSLYLSPQGFNLEFPIYPGTKSKQGHYYN
jgi:hypothetical protein